MRNKRRGDRFCQCIPYGKIEPKKLERLQKNRQRQMCTWRDIAPFSERHEEIMAVNTRPNNAVNKLIFPPIYELPCITNPESYRAMYNTGNGEMISNDIHTNSGRLVEESKAKPCHYGCSLTLRNDNQEEEGDSFNNNDYNELGNKTESQSLRLKLPKLTGVNVVNQRF